MGCATVVDDFVAYYLLENDSADCTGNYNGTDTGVTYDGEKAHFDGNDYISLPTMGGFASWSISVWFDNRGTDRYGNLFTALVQRDFGVIFDEREDRFYFHSRETGSIAAPEDSSPLGVMQHLVTTCDGTTLKLYVNKIEVNSEACSLAMPSTTYKIGRFDAEYSEGYQRHTRVYNRALTQAEITEIYNAERAYTYFTITSNDTPFENLELFEIVSSDIYFENFEIVSTDIAINLENFTITSTDTPFENLENFTITSSDISFENLENFTITSTDIPFESLELFEIISIDMEGYLELFTIVSTNKRDMIFRKFAIVSNDRQDSYEAKIIVRVNA